MLGGPGVQRLVFNNSKCQAPGDTAALAAAAAMAATAPAAQQQQAVPSKTPDTHLTGGTKPAPMIGTLASVLVGSMPSA